MYKRYIIESKNSDFLYESNSKLLAILKCLFNRNAGYVLEFNIDSIDNYDLVGCVFSKKKSVDV